MGFIFGKIFVNKIQSKRRTETIENNAGSRLFDIYLIYGYQFAVLYLTIVNTADPLKNIVNKGPNQPSFQLKKTGEGSTRLNKIQKKEVIITPIKMYLN